jgi:hypothetical protein
MKPYTLKQFIEYCHMIDCLNSAAPPHTITKKKYSVLKSKSVTPRIVETLADKNGIPYEKVTKGTSKKINDTNGIQELIVDYMKYVYGCHECRRVSSEGRWRPDKSNPNGGVFIPGLNKGMADVEGTLPNGLKFAIELKASKGDKQRNKQSERQHQLLQSKAFYYLCKWESFEQFQEEIQKLIPLM